MKQLEQFATKENVRKFLDVLSWAEGTEGNGYRTAFGGGLLQSLSDHPRYLKPFKQTDGKSNKTSAAGRYQFIQPTWDALSKQYGFKDFGPKNQDLAAVALIKEAGALPDVLAGRWENALQKTGRIWASLPSSTAPQKKRSYSETLKKLGARQMASMEQIQKILANVSAAKKQKGNREQPNMVDENAIAKTLKAHALEKQRQKKSFFGEGAGEKWSSAGWSALGGLANVGGGMLQGVGFAGDKINQGINAVLGTDLSTDGYEAVTEDLAAMNAAIDSKRFASGRGERDGSDWVKTGTGIAATVPAFLLGGGAGNGLKSAAQFAGRQGAIGAGVGAVQYAEDGSERLGNVAGGAAGGAVGGLIGEKVLAPILSKAGAAVAGRTKSATELTKNKLNQEANKRVNQAMHDAGKTLNAEARQSLIDDVVQTLKTGKDVNPDALANRVRLDQVGLGSKATTGQLSKNPVQWQKEQALSKREGIGDGLRRKFYEDSTDIADLGRGMVDDFGGRPADDFAVSDQMRAAFQAEDDAAQASIGELFKQAEQMSGNSAKLNGVRFVDQASRELESSGLGSFMNGEMRSIMKGVFEKKGASEFSLGKAQELIKILNRRIKVTSDRAERAAYGIVRKNLERELQASLDEIGEGIAAGNRLGPAASIDEAEAALSQWRSARGKARERFERIDSMPLYQSVVDDVQPDKFFERFIVRGNQNELASTVQALEKTPEALNAVRAQTVTRIFDKATGTNGQISTAGLKREIDRIGWRRINTVLGRDKTLQLKNIVDAADVLFTEPRRAAVNHSNTAAGIANGSRSSSRALQFLGLSRYVPVLAEAAENIGEAYSKRQAGQALKGSFAQGKFDPSVLSAEQKEVLAMLARLGSGASGSAGSGAGR